MCCHDDTIHRLLQPCRGLCANPFPDSLTMCVKVQPPLPLLLHSLPARHPTALLCLRNLDLKCAHLKCYVENVRHMASVSTGFLWVPSLRLLLLLLSCYFSCESASAEMPQKHNLFCLGKKNLWQLSSRRYQVWVLTVMAIYQEGSCSRGQVGE